MRNHGTTRDMVDDMRSMSSDFHMPLLGADVHAVLVRQKSEWRILTCKWMFKDREERNNCKHDYGDVVVLRQWIDAATMFDELMRLATGSLELCGLKIAQRAENAYHDHATLGRGSTHSGWSEYRIRPAADVLRPGAA